MLRFVSTGMLPACAGNEDRQADAVKSGLAHYYNVEKLAIRAKHICAPLLLPVNLHPDPPQTDLRVVTDSSNAFS